MSARSRSFVSLRVVSLARLKLGFGTALCRAAAVIAVGVIAVGVMAAGPRARAAEISRATLTLRQRLAGVSAGAHQGGVFGYYPNTIRNFEAAIEAGVDIIEMDLRLTKDGVPVAFHDEYLENQTNCKGRVADWDYEYVRRCNYEVGAHGMPVFARDGIPTFYEVLALAKDKVVINAEFKDMAVVPVAIRAVRAMGAYDRVYFQTKNEEAKYRAARAEDPKVALLFAADHPDGLAFALAQHDPQLLVIEIDDALRKPEYIAEIHAAGKLVSENAWHYDRFQELFGAACRKVFEQGIDIAISNTTSKCAKQARVWEKAHP